MNLAQVQKDEVMRSILEGDQETAQYLAESFVSLGIPQLTAVEPFIAAIRNAGALFEQGDFFLPQLLLSANAMKAALAVLFPDSEAGTRDERISKGTVVAGTVQGDIHEIGKNLVCALLAANGFRITDLGADVPLDRFVEEVQRQQANVLVLSALLTTTMINQKTVIDKLQQAGLRERVVVMVGGAPVTADWAKQIGADGYAPDAARAVDVALKLVGK
ncbi:MAG: corrinoid protein [bacterium]